MSYLRGMDAAIQAARGGVSSLAGQPYDLYRLSSATQGCVVSGDPLASEFEVRLRRTTERVAIEGEIFSLICYEGTCDNRTLQLQDAILETGFEAQTSGVYIFAQERPTRESLFMRAESFVQVVRPTPTAGNPEQQPTSGFAFIEGYGGIANSTDEILTLVNGVYSFQSSGSPASVPCGLWQLNRVHDGHALDVPTDQPRSNWLIYCPVLGSLTDEELGGEQPQEYDIFKFGNGDSYMALTVAPLITGMTGYTILAEKRGSA